MVERASKSGPFRRTCSSPLGVSVNVDVLAGIAPALGHWSVPVTEGLGPPKNAPVAASHGFALKQVGFVPSPNESSSSIALSLSLGINSIESRAACKKLTPSPGANLRGVGRVRREVVEHAAARVEAPRPRRRGRRAVDNPLAHADLVQRAVVSAVRGGDRRGEPVQLPDSGRPKTVSEPQENFHGEVP